MITDKNNSFKYRQKASEKGQVMLLTVLIISGAVLGATTLAAVLMLNQIRQTTDIIDSLQAAYAADTGLEWELYTNFVDSNYPRPQLEKADFVVENLTANDRIEFRSVGCAGAFIEKAPLGRCPRRLNRSFQLIFKLVE